MMKELSMHIMDIAENSIRANASLVQITIEELTTENKFNIFIKDDGDGMDEDFLREIRDPFKTSRTTRKVGLGIPMLEQTCIQCGGYLEIKSKKGEGTELFTTMERDNIDRPPLGDIVSTIHLTIIMNEGIDFLYKHRVDDNEFEFDTREVKEVLEGVSFKEPEVSTWIRENLKEGISDLYK